MAKVSKGIEVVKTGRVTSVSDGKGGTASRNIYELTCNYDEITEINREYLTQEKAVLLERIIKLDEMLSLMPEEDEPVVLTP